MKIEDPTLRKGDSVGGANGLLVATPDRRGAAMNFTPAPERITSKDQRPAVVAKE